MTFGASRRIAFTGSIVNWNHYTMNMLYQACKVLSILLFLYYGLAVLFANAMVEEFVRCGWPDTDDGRGSRCPPALRRFLGGGSARLRHAADQSVYRRLRARCGDPGTLAVAARLVGLHLSVLRLDQPGQLLQAVDRLVQQVGSARIRVVHRVMNVAQRTHRRVGRRCD